MPFYDDSEDRKQCYKECPKEKPYYQPNSDICTDKCEVVDYETKRCVFGCSFDQYWAKDENDVKYCLKECNREFGEYLSLDNQCVKECDSNKNLVKYIVNNINKQCKCINLYYLANNGSKICMIKEANDCGMINSPYVEYKYRIYDTNECSKNCFGYLSPSEDFCYNIRICHVGVTYGSYKNHKRCNHTEETDSVDCLFG